MADDTISWFAAVDWGSEQHQACILDAAGRSKYPPAKPGALECWPLKAASQVADATRGM